MKVITIIINEYTFNFTRHQIFNCCSAQMKKVIGRGYCETHSCKEIYFI